MDISFDLDSTLIPHGGEFKTEKRNLIGKMFKIEEIRKGTYELIKELQKDGHKVHIYTTSFRTKRKIKLTFRCYGLSIGRVINQTKNQKTLKLMNVNSSKYLPAFNFDLHIDDSDGVGIEAERLKFNVIIVKPEDRNWVEKIKNRIRTLGNTQSSISA